ncbi:MAG: hypothetical protein GPOALKHO_000998 [Sodalis sp.]|nr:MAG: hypothetical protein GPOALKHO_000998 [Sodalis sp.]
MVATGLYRVQNVWFKQHHLELWLRGQPQHYCPAITSILVNKTACGRMWRCLRQRFSIFARQRLYRAFEQAEPCAGGVLILAFFTETGYRNCLRPRPACANLDADNFSAANLCLVVVENTTYGLRFRMDLFRQHWIAVTKSA